MGGFVELTLSQAQRRVDQSVQRSWGPMTKRSRKTRNQTCEHAELLELCITLQSLHPQQKQAHAFTTDLQNRRKKATLGM